MSHDSRLPSFVPVIASLGFAVVIAACGASATKGGLKSAPKALSSSGFKNAPRCDVNKPGRELSYHDLSGTGRPDMVEVIGYSKGASGISEGRPLCMELDTNRDGTLDLLRVFDDKGEIESEEADRNYDGKSDIWITYEKGQIAKQSFDTMYKGNPDEFHFYRDGKLKRIERDRNGDGKMDIWEFYLATGQLERMGVDLDFNGKVDTWYRDELARAEQKKTAAANAPAPSASAAPSATTPPKTKSSAAL
ncbi:MAG: hypothetical protein ABI175_10535 [Polyangiales bacterium]